MFHRLKNKSCLDVFVRLYAHGMIPELQETRDSIGNIFALATDFFFKIGRSKYFQNRVLTVGTVFSRDRYAECTTAITVRK